MSKKPQDNAFQQQRLKAWQPLLTPSWVIGTFGILGVIFVPLGILILDASSKVFEVEAQYNHIVPEGTTEEFLCTAQKNNCELVTLNLAITEDVEPPIFFYYKLTNFYQNHRRYVKSRSDSQLNGDLQADISSCDPLVEWGENQTKLYPCGLIANSQFNDTFTAVLNPDTDNIFLNNSNWDDTDIMWQSDLQKFNVPAEGHDAICNGADFSCVGPGGFVMPKVTNPHFMVWMRTAGLPTFKKLYAVIKDQSLSAGDVVQISFENTFPVKQFEGEKWVVLSTTSWLGGKNSFLGYAYIVVGAVCLTFCLGFMIKLKTSPRPLGDMKYFSWPGSQPNPQDA